MYGNDHRIRVSVLAGALGASAAAVHALPALAGSWPDGLPRSPAPISPWLRSALGVEDSTRASGYALTFDDGPHPQGTPAVLEILRREGVRATFFLVGEQVLRAPALAREIVAAGHGIAVHCHHHRNSLRLTPIQLHEDLARAHDVIVANTAREPALYRPPYGVLSASALGIARARGWRTMLWSHWGLDWQAHATPASIAARVTDGAGAGAVLLLHDADDYSAPGSWQRMVAALPRVIETMRERGLEATQP
jgi:peptidoglycan-N-acetylglucosamine deacetylase